MNYKNENINRINYNKIVSPKLGFNCVIKILKINSQFL